MYNLWYFVAFYAVLLQKVNFFAIYAVFRKISLLQFTRYCVEKILAQISDRGEKLTNMRYVPWVPIVFIFYMRGDCDISGPLVFDTLYFMRPKRNQLTGHEKYFRRVHSQ